MFPGSKPANIVAYLQRIDSTVLTGRRPLEAWREFLKKNGAGAGNNYLKTMESNFLATQSSSAVGTRADRVRTYMGVKGFAAANIGDAKRKYLSETALQ